MKPEYLEELADMADPNSLWRLPALEALNLPPHKRAQLDAGVALRRHADHVRRLRDLQGKGKSLLITPLTANGTATKIVPAPAEHMALLDRHETATPQRGEGFEVLTVSAGSPSPPAWVTGGEE